MIPFGFVLGVAINDSAMPTVVAWSTSPLIFAGAAQLALVSLAGTVSWITLVATAAVINVRHVMYSAALAPRFGDQPRWFRWVGPFVMVDQVFALLVARDQLAGKELRRYYITIGLFFYTGWQIVVALGLVLGSTIPEGLRLDVAPAIMFAGIVVLGITRSSAVVAAVVGGGVCMALLGLPNNLGLLIGALAGVVAGYLAEQSSGDPAVGSAP